MEGTTGVALTGMRMGIIHSQGRLYLPSGEDYWSLRAGISDG